jgi:hypothetical protein
MSTIYIFLFEENMMKCFLFYFFEIPEIFPYKTPDLEYVNFATPCMFVLWPNVKIITWS